MDAPIDYAIEKATPDVAQTIMWLQSEGFRVSDLVGGPGESFGNVLLTFERGLSVTVVHDRGQWMIDVGSLADGKTHGLHVLITAMTGAEPNPGPAGERLRELPDQLPGGVAWTTEVPRVVRWLESMRSRRRIAVGVERWVVSEVVRASSRQRLK